MIEEVNQNLKKEERQIRERRFHNEIFEANVRQSLSIFYKTNESIRAKFRDLLSEFTSKEVLEIGCGLGLETASLASNGAIVTAVDISERAINEAKKSAKRTNIEIDFRLMDAEALEFEKDKFDLVCGTGILHHLDLRIIVPEIKRVLKKKGKAIFIEPMSHNPIIRVFRYLTPQLRSRDEHPLRMKDLQLISKGFAATKCIHYFFLSLLALPFCKLGFYERITYILENLDQKMFNRLPAIKRFSWQVLLILEK